MDGRWLVVPALGLVIGAKVLEQRARSGSAADPSLPRARRRTVSPQAAMVLAGEPSLVGDDTMLATLLQGTTGKRTSREVAHEVLRAVQGDVLRLADRDLDLEIDDLQGEGRARLIAAAELTRRAFHRAHLRRTQPIVTPRQVLEYLETLTLGPYETLSAIYLNHRHVPIGWRELTRGNDAFTIVDPRQIFRPAIQLGASSLIMCHNHPSGDPTPSAQDRDITRRVLAAGKVLGIKVLDHLVIVGGGRFTSLAEQGDIVGFEALPVWSGSSARSRSR